jgi:hypothetical protein
LAFRAQPPARMRIVAREFREMQLFITSNESLYSRSLQIVNAQRLTVFR